MSNADDQDNYLMVRYFQRAPQVQNIIQITTNEPDWTVATVAPI